MATDVWKANAEIQEKMAELVGAYHPDLALVLDEMVVVFREKAAKKGGRVVLGKPRKGSPLLSALSKTDYKFILEIAADEWESLNTKRQTALIDRLLCGCRTEEDAKTGALKCFLVEPDVSYYYDELSRYGDWMPRPEGEEPEGPEDPVAVLTPNSPTAPFGPNAGKAAAPTGGSPATTPATTPTPQAAADPQADPTPDTDDGDDDGGGLDDLLGL